MSGCSLTRRVITWLLVGLYGLVASGLPLPFGMPLPGEARGGDRVAASRLAAKDRSRPFPCMDKPCGCATAEQCFANCCCHTPAERLAWARAHKVEPAILASLEARVAGERLQQVVAAKAPDAPACCCATPAAACEPASAMNTPASAGTLESAGTLAAQPSCCASPAASLTARAEAAARPDTDTDADEPPPRGKVVVLRALLACGGLAAEWFALGSGGLPPPRIEFVPRAGRDEPLVAADETPVRLATPPAAPPPRAV